MAFVGGSSVTIVNRSSSSVDDYGNPQYSTTETVIPNCFVAHGTSTEPVDIARTPIDAMLTIYFPHGTNVADADLFLIAGETWVKDGDPDVWDTVNGFDVGVVVSVRRRRG